MSTDIDFDFIKEVGEKIGKIYLSDSSQNEWFYNIIDEYNTNEQYPNDLILSVINYIKSLDIEESEKIIDDIKAIIRDEDNINNLLGYIFFPAINEEEEEEADDNINTKSISLPIVDDDNDNDDDDDDDDDEINLNNLDSKAYLEFVIKKIMNTLSISHDISYALCMKFNLDKDLILQKWVSSQEEVLKSLRIKVGSDTVPSCKSPLTIKPSVGECSICFDDTEIYQLYCGHKICKECLILEIKELISEGKIPICRQMCEDDDNKLCLAEIMTDDVKKFLNDDELFEKYTKILVNKETTIFKGVQKCPNDYCDAIITPLTEMPCHVGRCSQCGAFVCLKCKQDCHAPIFLCSKVDHFFVTLAESMQKLKDDQKNWVKREMKLIDYRVNAKNDIHSAFNVRIQNLKKEFIKKNNKDEKVIREMSKELSEIQQNIVALTKKKSGLDKESSEYKSITEKIQELRTLYNQKDVIYKRIQSDNQSEIKRQNIELESIEKEENLLALCYSRNTDFKSSFFDYEVLMNNHAISKIKLLSQDWIKDHHTKEREDASAEAVIKGLYKRCPKCKTPIERISGCNHMSCQICGTEFCYICGDLWSEHYEFICPKYNAGPQINTKKRKGSYSKKEPGGNHFYEPPMTVEKRVDYFRWNNSYSQFQVKKEKYNKLFSDFRNKKNIKLAPGEIAYADSKLCTRNRIAKVLLKTVERKDVKMKTYRIMNEVLFAESVIMWGYPALYYMINNPDKAMLFEYKLFLLEETTDKFVDLLHKPGNSTAKDFDTNVDILERQIIDILTIAEEF